MLKSPKEIIKEALEQATEQEKKQFVAGEFSKIRLTLLFTLSALILWLFEAMIVTSCNGVCLTRTGTVEILLAVWPFMMTIAYIQGVCAMVRTLYLRHKFHF